MKLKPVLILSLLIAPLAAQETRGYFFVGPVFTGSDTSSTASFGFLPVSPASSSSTNRYIAGAGLEFRPSAWAGVGFDLAGIMPSKGKVIGTTSVAASPEVYLYVPSVNWQSASFNPYAVGGYTGMFNGFNANGFNAGGGFYYWLGQEQRSGIMVEFRAVKLLGTIPASARDQYYQFRFGYTFRK